MSSSLPADAARTGRAVHDARFAHVQPTMRATLERIAGTPGLSRDVYELATKSLG